MLKLPIYTANLPDNVKIIQKTIKIRAMFDKGSSRRHNRYHGTENDHL